jgi:hypothetical protein
MPLPPPPLLVVVEYAMPLVVACSSCKRSVTVMLHSRVMSFAQLKLSRRYFSSVTNAVHVDTLADATVRCLYRPFGTREPSLPSVTDDSLLCASERTVYLTATTSADSCRTCATKSSAVSATVTGGPPSARWRVHVERQAVAAWAVGSGWNNCREFDQGSHNSRLQCVGGTQCFGQWRRVFFSAGKVVELAATNEWSATYSAKA